MSKGEYIREMSDLQVLNKARNLAVYTLSVTDNDKNFPKKHWKSFLQPMNMEARGITILISMANSIYVTTRHEFWIRNGLQTIALALTYALAESIELAHIKFKVSDKRVKYWIGLLYETRTLLRNWRNSDKQRFKKFKRIDITENDVIHEVDS